MQLNRLVLQYQKDAGEVGYKMKSFDIEVIAKSTGGLAPTILYFHDNQDITDDIRSLRFEVNSPYSYIDDYEEFQTMLYKKSNVHLIIYMIHLAFAPKTCLPLSRYYGALASCF